SAPGSGTVTGGTGSSPGNGGCSQSGSSGCPFPGGVSPGDVLSGPSFAGGSSEGLVGVGPLPPGLPGPCPSPGGVLSGKSPCPLVGGSSEGLAGVGSLSPGPWPPGNVSISSALEGGGAPTPPATPGKPPSVEMYGRTPRT